PSVEFGPTHHPAPDDDHDDYRDDVDFDVDPEDLVDLEEVEEADDLYRSAPEPEAPWSPVATDVARRFRQQHPDAAIDVVFPTVYEENRSEVIRDVVTAQAEGHLTHRRAAEIVAKELGIEQYDYEEEQRQIRAERAARVGPLTLGAGDALIPALGAAGDPSRRRDDREPKRADLSHAAKSRFRKQQREVRALAEAVTQLAAAQRPRAVRYERDEHGAIVRSVPEAPSAVREAPAVAPGPTPTGLTRVREADVHAAHHWPTFSAEGYALSHTSRCGRCGGWTNCPCPDRAGACACPPEASV
ncbi:MAG: hypothetical protein ACREM3_27960, partial [Candidatus Rokuibacteriota bacterium]